MRAAVYDTYTDHRGIVVRDIDPPELDPERMLVRVHAASLNAFDWHMYKGEPTVMRLRRGGTLHMGRRVTEPRILGCDLGGTVEAVGDAVTGFRKGDRIMAQVGRGSCAEYAIVHPGAAMQVADNVSFEAAAATPLAGVTALQALRDAASLTPGDRVLIWGAAGGVGHLAVQIAKALGAVEVHAVCSTANVTWVAGLGATRVFDYTTEDITRSGEKYDVILDTVSTASIGDLKGILAPGGRVVPVGSRSGGRVLGPIGSLVSRMTAAKIHRVKLNNMLARTTLADLELLATWLADGSLVPRIQRSYRLDEASEACRELESHHVAGKLIVTP